MYNFTPKAKKIVSVVIIRVSKKKQLSNKNQFAKVVSRMKSILINLIVEDGEHVFP